MSAIQGASNLSQAQLASQVSTAVLRKALDNAKSQGAAINSLLETAAAVQDKGIRADPHKGTLLDVSA